jgi:oligoribonuclease
MNDEIMWAWMDMETTGLEANLDVPLELGIVLSNIDGEVIAEKKWLVYEQENEDFMKGVDRGRNNTFVRSMHEESGLWDDLRVFKSYSRDEVDMQAVQFLEENGIEAGWIGMAGNSTGSLDRPFTLVHFPKLNVHLGYRNIDMSSLKELMKRLNPDLFKQLEPVINNKAAAMHRVLDDCRACIKEYLAYCNEFLLIE